MFKSKTPTDRLPMSMKLRKLSYPRNITLSKEWINQSIKEKYLHLYACMYILNLISDKKEYLRGR